HELDLIDLSPILQDAYGSGRTIPSMVRAFQVGTGANLQVDIVGDPYHPHWVTIARLEGLQAGNTINVHLAWWEPGGPTIAVMPPSTSDFNIDHNSDIFWQTDGGALAIWDINGTTIKDADYLHS